MINCFLFFFFFTDSKNYNSHIYVCISHINLGFVFYYLLYIIAISNDISPRHLLFIGEEYKTQTKPFKLRFQELLMEHLDNWDNLWLNLWYKETFIKIRVERPPASQTKSLVTPSTPEKNRIKYAENDRKTGTQIWIADTCVHNRCT